MPGLGRLYKPDPRDYPMRQVHRAMGLMDAPLPTSKLWRLGEGRLDQGETGTCVAHGWENLRRSSPSRHKGMHFLSPFDQYRKMVLLDDIPANDAEAHAPDSELQSGTTVRAGARYYQQQGIIDGKYVFAERIADVIRHVCFVGPTVMGTEWLQAMFTPDREGIVKLEGDSAGGHCYLLYGIDNKRGLALFENSWGEAWGGWQGDGPNTRRMPGCFKMALEDVEALLYRQGEACAPVELGV